MDFAEDGSAQRMRNKFWRITVADQNIRTHDDRNLRNMDAPWSRALRLTFRRCGKKLKGAAPC